MKRIANIPVTNAEFQMLKFVLTVERQASWKPSRADIAELIRSERNPSQKEQQDMKRFDIEMDRSYRLNEPK